jgi:hypothetical protein
MHETVLPKVKPFKKHRTNVVDSERQKVENVPLN